MKTRWVVLLVFALLLVLCVAAEQNQSSTRGHAPASHQPPKADSEAAARFETHCGRCHNPPESISRSEAKAVVMHMRVRALLSAEDEKLILDYIAPR